MHGKRHGGVYVAVGTEIFWEVADQWQNMGRFKLVSFRLDAKRQLISSKIEQLAAFDYVHIIIPFFPCTLVFCPQYSAIFDGERLVCVFRF